MKSDQPRRKLPVVTFPYYVAQWLSTIALAIIAVYRVALSPILFSVSGLACRFEPTCSAYAAEAIARYGITRGAWIALKRLMKCRPLGGWGFDPLPATRCASEANSGGYRGLSR
jgi:putative membrane protein insertion efficiency factor